MTDMPGWRRAFDAVERNVSPRVETLVHSEEFARMTAVIARSRRLAGNRANAIAARVWHLMNLPAGTNFRRLACRSVRWIERYGGCPCNSIAIPASRIRSRSIVQPFPSPMSVVERVRREVERNALRVRNGIRLAAGIRPPGVGHKPDTAKGTVR